MNSPVNRKVTRAMPTHNVLTQPRGVSLSFPGVSTTPSPALSFQRASEVKIHVQSELQDRSIGVQVKHGHWTNSSVLMLAGDDNPIDAITQRARTVVFDAIQNGWLGPPFDPFALADHLKLAIVPREDIADARTIASGSSSLTIEFNPNRSRGRVRYSICHEIAHTLFPDCRKFVRNRLAHDEMHGDDWQLEMLCNIAASELLMPIGSLPRLEAEHLTIDSIMELRKKYDVSTEAILLRTAWITSESCTVFTASRRDREQEAGYQVDYAVASKDWNKPPIPVGFRLPNGTVASECTAIGFTAKAHEEWNAPVGKLRVECVGIPSYPGDVLPRVAGLLKTQRGASSHLPEITYLRGDATRPRGDGFRVVAQIVNDQASTWGGGFALVVRKKWTTVQESFRSWAETGRNLQLGNVHVAIADSSTAVFNMVCQHGYGPSPKPRIRYAHLRACLDQLASFALQKQASVHIPRIGCGQAGGSWEIVRELVDYTLCRQGVRVTVYDPPNADIHLGSQPALNFSGSASS
jgi:O-acetyl-ADP-ribose deacetylase (regulator of RNase III)